MEMDANLQPNGIEDHYLMLESEKLFIFVLCKEVLDIICL